MAISKNALLTAGLATFGISLAVAAGPYGLAFAAALLYSSIIALAMTAIIYGISEGNFQSSGSRVRPIVTPVASSVVHTKQFVPAGGVRVLPSAVPASVVHTKQFVPAARVPVTPKTHTRHFVPAAAPSVEFAHHASRTFVPVANLSRTAAPSAVPTSPPPVSHTRTFVPRT